MEALHILEERIARLIESKKQDLAIIAELREQIAGLTKQNEQLKFEVKQVEGTLLTQKERETNFDKERENTKAAVDDLIGSIDALIDSGMQV